MYSVCLDYQFTEAGIEAVKKGIDWNTLLEPKYNGIYYWLKIKTSEGKYAPLIEQIKKELHKDQFFNTKKDLEERIKIPRNKNGIQNSEKKYLANKIQK